MKTEGFIPTLLKVLAGTSTLPPLEPLTMRPRHCEPVGDVRVDDFIMRQLISMKIQNDIRLDKAHQEAADANTRNLDDKLEYMLRLGRYQQNAYTLNGLLRTAIGKEFPRLVNSTYNVDVTQGFQVSGFNNGNHLEELELRPFAPITCKAWDLIGHILLMDGESIPFKKVQPSGNKKDFQDSQDLGIIKAPEIKNLLSMRVALDLEFDNNRPLSRDSGPEEIYLWKRQETGKVVGDTIDRLETIRACIEVVDDLIHELIHHHHVPAMEQDFLTSLAIGSKWHAYRLPMEISEEEPEPGSK